MRTLKFILSFAILFISTIISFSQSQLYFENFDTIKFDFSTWISNRKCKITQQPNFSGNWMQLYREGIYVLPIKQLPSNFRFEFDFIYKATSSGNNLTEIIFFAKKENEEFDLMYPGKNGIRIGLENFVISYISYHCTDIENLICNENRTGIIESNKPSHISIELKNNLLTISVNKEIIFKEVSTSNLKITPNTILFSLKCSESEPMLSNITLQSL